MAVIEQPTTSPSSTQDAPKAASTGGTADVTTAAAAAAPVKDAELMQIERQAIEFAKLANLPDLNGPGVEVAPVDIMDGYWSPEKAGEARRLYFDSIRERETLDGKTGEVLVLPTVFFLERQEDTSLRMLCNSSAHLVSRFDKGNIEQYTPFEVTYKGREKNATNDNLSARWSVKPLVVQI